MSAGLQAERTALAWVRTALLQVGVAALAYRVLLVDVPGGALLGLALALPGVVLLASARRLRRGAERDLARGGRTPRWPAAALVAVAVVVVAAVGAVAAVVDLVGGSGPGGS